MSKTIRYILIGVGLYLLYKIFTGATSGAAASGLNYPTPALYVPPNNSTPSQLYTPTWGQQLATGFANAFGTNFASSLANAGNAGYAQSSFGGQATAADNLSNLEGDSTDANNQALIDALDYASQPTTDTGSVGSADYGGELSGSTDSGADYSDPSGGIA